MIRIFFQVLGCFLIMITPLTAFADELRDVKAPVAFPLSYTPILALLAILIIASVGYFIYRGRRNTRAKKPSPEALKTAWEKACGRLEALAKSGLLEQGEFSAYYLRLSDIVRQYMEDRFRIRAPEMTTEEFLAHLKNSPALSARQDGVLTEFLTSCDMVKFAKYLPRVEEACKNTQLARRLVDETKEEHHAQP
jgi:hypothetical protein